MNFGRITHGFAREKQEIVLNDGTIIKNIRKIEDIKPENGEHFALTKAEILRSLEKFFGISLKKLKESLNDKLDKLDVGDPLTFSVGKNDQEKTVTITYCGECMQLCYSSGNVYRRRRIYLLSF